MRARESRSHVARCDDCQIEYELFKDLVRRSCVHGPTASRQPVHSR